MVIRSVPRVPVDVTPAVFSVSIKVEGSQEFKSDSGNVYIVIITR